MSEEPPKTKAYLFQPGQARPPGSGMKKGQKTRKVLAREAEKYQSVERILELTASLPRPNMTPAEICEFLGVNVTVGLVVTALEMNETGQTRLAAWRDLKTITNPTLKSSEVKTEQVHTLKVEYQSPFAAQATQAIEVDAETVALPRLDDEGDEDDDASAD